MRDFNTWYSQFRKFIAGYKYYTDFNKVYKNVDSIKIELNIMNSLIGSNNIEAEFHTLCNKYPEILKCIPILLAKRETEIPIKDTAGEFIYKFKKPNYPIEQYIIFMRETGLFELMKSKHINNLVDYVTGVETGLDSNARKNRGGDEMENLVESYLQKAGLVKGITYFKEMKVSDIQHKWGIDLSSITNKDGNKKSKAEKRFDFVIKREHSIYGIETNFYGSQGSKLNETARSYKTLALETANLEYFHFVWITDGQGWEHAKSNLKETFEVLNHLYNIHELDCGIIENKLI